MTEGHFPDIFIVGLGISGYTQVTKETEQALSVAKKIFYVHTEPYIKEYLKRFCDDIEDLYSLYVDHQNRMLTYDAMADRVMNEAKNSSPVVFALYGHPYCFVTPSKTVLREGPKRGLKVEMLPGVSALDTLFVDLHLDPSDRGLVQYEANYCLLFRPQLDPAVPCLIWQPGAVETRGYNPRPSKPERFYRLRDYIRQFYPGEHKLSLTTCASNPLVDPEMIWSTVDEFPSLGSTITGLSTMFIPPARDPRLTDPKILAEIDDPNHIAALVQSA
jgi:tetrapyrrole methylase family protein / MazG family protein